MRTEAFSSVIFSLSFLLSLSSCSRDPIKIGLSLVLTGINSEIGVTGRNGAQLALNRINAAGGVNGRQLEFVIRDDKDDPDQAVIADSDLIQAGVVAIIGHMTSRSGLKSIPYLNEHSKLIISPTITSAVYNARDDWLFRMIAPCDRQGRRLAEYAYQELGLRKVAAAYEYSNRSYTEIVYKSFKNAFEGLGGKVDEGIPFSSSKDFDYRFLADRLTRSRPDGIVSIAGPFDNGNLCQQLTIQKSNLPVLTGMWSMTEDILRYGGKATNRMIIAGSMDPDSEKHRFKIFKEEYKRRYGENPTFASVYTFEAVEVLSSALQRTDSLDSENLKKALLGLGRIDGLQDDFAFDSFGDTDREYSIFKISEGKFSRIP